jgi:hypothetical protein
MSSADADALPVSQDLDLDNGQDIRLRSLWPAWLNFQLVLGSGVQDPGLDVGKSNDNKGETANESAWLTAKQCGRGSASASGWVCLCCCAGPGAREAESDGEEEAACREPDYPAQIMGRCWQRTRSRKRAFIILSICI